MGIVKLRQRRTGNCNHTEQSSCTFALDDESMQDDVLLLEQDPGDGYKDCQLAEVGCEYVMAEDHICSIPYDLYDLPDLKEILSLNTWNSYLTEDERFTLAAYLPDMDLETFWLTMKGLFDSENIFFGSPLEKLFLRLKGGFYSLQVSQFREGLQSLQRREYCHFLRSYHESMLQKFADMKRAWSTCQPSSSVVERVSIWNNRRAQKAVLLVDLNAFPAEEENMKDGDKNGTTISLLKKTRHTNEVVSTDNSTVVMNGTAANRKARAKGVLKVKPNEPKLVHNYIARPLPSDSKEPSRRPPKGVLKIKPKSDPLAQHEREQTSLILPKQSLGSTQAYGFSPPQFASKWHEGNSGQDLPITHHTVRDGRTREHPVLPETLNGRESLNMVVGQVNNSLTPHRKIGLLKDTRVHDAEEMQEEIFPFKNNQKAIYTRDAGGIGKHHDDENLMLNLNLWQRSRVQCGSSPDSNQSASENYPGRREMIPLHLTGSDAVSRISTAATDKHYLKSSDQLEYGHDHNDALLPSFHIASGGQREDLILPITYKRKKPCKKLNPGDSRNQSSMVANLEAMSAKIDSRFNRKAKPIKIKVKGWTNYNGQYK